MVVEIIERDRQTICAMICILMMTTVIIETSKAMEALARMSKSVLSIWLDNSLNQFGYSEEDIKQRILYVKRCSFAKDVSNKKLMKKYYIDKIFVGSQRDGTAESYMSDFDIMQINNSVCCLSDVMSMDSLTNDNVFQMVRQDVPSGYCKLKLYSVGNQERFKDVSYALTKQSYLSNSKYVERNEDFYFNSATLIGRNTKYQQRNGPSIPKFVEMSKLQMLLMAFAGINIKPQIMDFVKALPCECPDIIERWRTRVRRFDWQGPSTIDHVATLPGHVVPVGLKHATDSDLQWRICYTLAEIKLVQSFNNTQTKVYVILKFIAKHMLSKNTLVTSYVMKNIMFWMCEYTPSNHFQPESILQHASHALKVLRKCLLRGRLRNYMIPERNLFQDELSVFEKNRITNDISLLVQKGQRILRRYIGLYIFTTDKLPKTSFDFMQDLTNYCLIEKVNQLQVQCLSNPELINMFIDMSACNNRLSSWKMCIDQYCSLLKTYGPRYLSNPMDIPLEPVESRLKDLHLPDTVVMGEVIPMNNDRGIVSFFKIIDHHLALLDSMVTLIFRLLLIVICILDNYIQRLFPVTFEETLSHPVTFHRRIQ